MLHLARVTKRDPDGKATLQLLAQQKAEHAWVVLSEADAQLWVDTEDYSEGVLVLVELSPSRQVQDIQTAEPWILDVLNSYLTIGVTPVLLQEEMQRAEQWRQSLTLQSQELGRRALEMEARRDQIQELEENLKQERKRLELMATELETKRDQIQELEETLKQERKRLELMNTELKTSIEGSPGNHNRSTNP